MQSDAVRTFVTQLRATQLLDPAQLEEAERLGRAATRPAELAGELVKRGWITRYQANQVARGRGAELVLGSYVVLEPLGAGGMGQVFKARHRYLQRHVALKLIRHDQRDSPDTVQRFQREVRLLAELRHRHIVQAHDAGYAGDTWFLAMELLEGVDLDSLVRQHGPLPIDQACAYARQAALGLQHAHERGLVHRDVKPANLLLTAEGIKLLDLGLARPQAVPDGGDAGGLTRANSVMGTPDYLAPEQALDPRRADARSDLYALGCALYFLLTGRPPFPEGSLAQKLLYHQQQAPTPAQALRPDVPPALAEVLRRLLAKSPQQRPASAAEVAAQLTPFAAPVPDGMFLAVPVEEPHGGPPSSGAGEHSGPAPSSLAQGRAAAPERGFTLVAEEAGGYSGSAPPSLAQGRAAAPERGFTLVAEEPVRPTQVAPPAQPTAALPRRGRTLTAESIPPSAVIPIAPARAPRRPLLWPWIAAGGGLAVVFVVVLVLLLSGGSPSGVPPVPGQRAEVDPKEKDALPNADIPKVKPKEKGGKPAPASKIFPNGPSRFLCYLPQFDVKAGEWPIKRGECGNGKAIKVGGVLSPHGLGMHPPFGGSPASAKYRLNREATLFKATVAVDDSTDWCWSPAVFTVLGDGKKLWSSEHISALKPHVRSQECKVLVEGVDVLELRVQAVNGNKGVLAVWVEPQILQKFDSPAAPRDEAKADEEPPAPGPPKKDVKLAVRVEPPQVLEPQGPHEKPDAAAKPVAVDPQLALQAPGSKVFLSDLQEFATKGSPLDWKFAKNGRLGDPGNSVIEIRGKLYPKGLGTHPPFGTYTRVCYALGKKAAALHGAVALNDRKDIWNPQPTRFVVLADGKVRWRSQTMNTRGLPEAFHLDVRGVDVLELRVYCERPTSTGSHAVWLDPYVVVG
jgi:eukaryotic-like serine/threonine-protein kinase